VAALVLTAFGAVAPFLDREALAATFPDDAFYYFQVARHAAAGGGFTFDGVHETNGFHPLWLFLLVPVFWLLPGDVPPLRAIALLQAALAAGAAAALYRILRGRIGRAAAFAAALAVAAAPGAPSVFRSGMESTLLLCFMLAVWGRWLGLATSSPLSLSGCSGLGLLCAGAFLTRLEAILLVPALMVLGGRRWLREGRALLALAAPPALAVSAYVAWNVLAFDTALPVSALVKAHWARRAPLTTFLRGVLDPPWAFHTLVCRLFGPTLECPPVATLLFWASCALAAGAAWRFRAALVTAVRQSGASLVLLSSGLVVLAAKLAVGRLESWYEGPIVLGAAVLGGALLSPSPRLARMTAAVAVLGAIARPPLTAWTARDAEARFAYYRIRAADWVRQNTPAGDRIGSWNAGTFAYFAHRPVVNLDGLVNDAAFFRTVIEERDLAGYLGREDIAWLADQACGPRLSPRSYLARGGAAHLESDFELAARFFRAGAPDGCPGYAVWRRREPLHPLASGSDGRAASFASTTPAMEASRPTSTGVNAPHPRPPVRSCAASIAATPNPMDARASRGPTEGRKRPPITGTKRLTLRSV
jgi:hypothetical protein